ncbi:MAG: hypothetical protein HY902_20590 [Deltaproteobacteria bacterium]|nr:hypothetical protein [Deltaproteobacteria bacterium]
MNLAWQLDVLQRLQPTSELGEATRGTNQSLNLSVGYGLSERWAVELTAPLILKQQDYIAGVAEQGRAVFGLGDPLALAKATLVGLGSRNPRQLRVGVAAGVKVPLGESQASRDGQVLPQAFQLSSGAWDGVLAGFFSVGALDRTTAMGSLILRVPTANAQGYRFGVSSTVSGDLQWIHLFPLVISAGARATWAAADHSPLEHVHASGGGQAAAHLGLGWNPGGAWFVTADAVVPVVRALTGNQMAAQHSWTLAVRTEL